VFVTSSSSLEAVVKSEGEQGKVVAVAGKDEIKAETVELLLCPNHHSADIELTRTMPIRRNVITFSIVAALVGLSLLAYSSLDAFRSLAPSVGTGVETMPSELTATNKGDVSGFCFSSHSAEFPLQLNKTACVGLFQLGPGSKVCFSPSAVYSVVPATDVLDVPAPDSSDRSFWVTPVSASSVRRLS
jgi:hypothetical protein